MNRALFPNGDKLPATNLPVGAFGQVTRDQRQQELEYFLNKQYNSIGIRLQSKLNSIEKQFQASDKEISNDGPNGNQESWITWCWAWETHRVLRQSRCLDDVLIKKKKRRWKYEKIKNYFYIFFYCFQLSFPTVIKLSIVADLLHVKYC